MKTRHEVKYKIRNEFRIHIYKYNGVIEFILDSKDGREHSFHKSRNDALKRIKQIYGEI